MNHVVCAVRDSAVNAFNPPFCVPAVGAAVRGFSDEVNNPQSLMNKHPDDFELFEIGLFDSASGRFDMLPEPRSLSRGKDVILPPVQQP